jgi:ABC-type transport system involved in cytochrome c biogenesis permease subunit
MMDNSPVNITAKPGLPAAASVAPEPRPPIVPSIRRGGVAYLLYRGLHRLASLRLTVALFVLSTFLVFVGTLAQVDAGIWTVVDSYFRSLYVWVPLQIFFPRAMHIGGSFPYPGGWLLGSLLLVNLLAAHAVRFKLSWKRSGIIILHSGIIVMMVSELVTGLFAVEGSMLIFEGKSANYLTHTRATELAVMPAGTSDSAEVVVIPMAILRQGDGVIKNEALPFDVQLVQYMVNSRLCKQMPPEFLPHDFGTLPDVPAGTKNLATAGLGARYYAAVELPEIGGVEQKGEDQAAAYVRFLHKATGKDLGTFMLPVLLQDDPQYVNVDGKNYGVRLTDPARSVDREVLISMNDPLRYGGETFYQQSFLPGDRATILQVVKNPGWLMPYFSCVMVALGMLIHFGMHLQSFLTKSAATRPTMTAGLSGYLTAGVAVSLGALYFVTLMPIVACIMVAFGVFVHFCMHLQSFLTKSAAKSLSAPRNLGSFLPTGIAVGVGAVYFMFVMIRPGDAPDRMHLHEAGSLPVVDGGRVMPMDTVARNSLMVISGRQEFVDDKDNRQPAVKWLFDVMASGGKEGPGLSHKVFRIENDQVLSLLHLEPRSGFRYSKAEIEPRFAEFARQYERVRKIPETDRDLYENKVFELAEHIHLFHQLSEWMVPKAIPPMFAGGEWRSLLEAAQQDLHQGQKDAATTDFFNLLSSYVKEDIKGFNASLTAYEQTLEKRVGGENAKTGFETFFNNFAPFYRCSALYVIVLILVCLSWASFTRELTQAAFALAVLTLAVHTFALLGRMYVMGRPLVFVTNLYSSAVFIGWICVILGLVLERFFANGLGIFVASLTGAITLVIGHYLATTGDTIGIMIAVLDTNFWLATHVTSVTIGYAATYVAGFLGIVLICLGVITPTLTLDKYRKIGSMIYGVVCFAMLFSFVGTVLGGIWADQSWGRFWGWDPKENGALLIVIWNALILHARWCGLVQQRGMAVLAVAGNIITTWSWFGVNMLGVGLHSYGFTPSQLMAVLTFVGSQLVVIGVGLVPMSKWPSFAAAKREARPGPDKLELVADGPTFSLTVAPNGTENPKKSKNIKAK